MITDRDKNIKHREDFADQVKNFIITLLPERRLKKSDIHTFIDYIDQVMFSVSNQQEIDRFDNLGMRHTNGLFGDNAAFPKFFTLNVRVFLDLIAQTISLKLLLSNTLSKITKWHPVLNDIDFNNDVSPKYVPLINVFKSQASKMILELKAIGIPAKVTTSALSNEEGYTLLELDQNQKINSRLLLDSVTNMRRIIAGKQWRINNEITDGADFLRSRKPCRVQSEYFGFNEEEVQLFNDFLLLVGASTDISESEIFYERITVQFASLGSCEPFLKKEGLKPYFQTYSSPNTCFLSTQSVYDFILKRKAQHALLDFLPTILSSDPWNIIIEYSKLQDFGVLSQKIKLEKLLTPILNELAKYRKSTSPELMSVAQTIKAELVKISFPHLQHEENYKEVISVLVDALHNPDHPLNKALQEGREIHSFFQTHQNSQLSSSISSISSLRRKRLPVLAQCTLSTAEQEGLSSQNKTTFRYSNQTYKYINSTSIPDRLITPMFDHRFFSCTSSSSSDSSLTQKGEGGTKRKRADGASDETLGEVGSQKFFQGIKGFILGVVKPLGYRCLCRKKTRAELKLSNISTF